MPSPATPFAASRRPGARLFHRRDCWDLATAHCHSPQSQDHYQSTVSSFLPRPKPTNFSGSLRLGPVGQPKRIKSTTFLKNPTRPSLYYVNQIGIRVGSKVVDIPDSALAFNTTNGGGLIYDSGTVYTWLVEPAYKQLEMNSGDTSGTHNRDVIGRLRHLLHSANRCVPKMTLMFNRMNETLLVDNLLTHSTAGSITCLAMVAGPDNVNSAGNVIASMQQQNHRVLMDVPNSRLGVAPEACS